MWTKGRIVDRAFKKIGFDDDFNVTPANRQDALDILDAMMANWSSRGIYIGYAMPSSESGSVFGDDSGLPDTAFEAVYTNLAQRIADEFGKTVTQTTMIQAKQAFDALLSVMTFPAQQQLPDTLPRGTGNKPWLGGGYPRPFFPTPKDPLTSEEGGAQLTFEQGSI